MNPPILIRPGTTDIDSYNQVFVSEYFEPVSNLKDIKIIVDAGAYIGCVCYYLAKKYPEAMIFAYESDEDNYDVINANVFYWTNGEMANLACSCYWATIWGTPDKCISLKGKTGEWSNYNKEDEHGRIAVTLNQLIDAHRKIDLLKMDIEGAELNVFQNDTSWLNKTRNMAIEIHGQECFGEVMTKMHDYKYEMSKKGDVYIFKNIKRR